jgi:transposase-like protein
MARLSFNRHRSPADVIRHAVWLCFRFTLSFRAVEDEGEALDLVLPKRRDTGAALRLLKRLLRNQHVEPESIVTDGLASCGRTLKLLRSRFSVSSDQTSDAETVPNTGRLRLEYGCCVGSTARLAPDSTATSSAVSSVRA